MSSGESYAYDYASNLTSKTVGSLTTTYTFDNANQLTGESNSGYSATYTYDANGNRSGSTINGTTSIYNVDDGDKLNSITTGCILLSRTIRQLISSSGDNNLWVVP